MIRMIRIGMQVSLVSSAQPQITILVMIAPILRISQSGGVQRRVRNGLQECVIEKKKSRRGKERTSRLPLHLLLLRQAPYHHLPFLPLPLSLSLPPLPLSLPLLPHIRYSRTHSNPNQCNYTIPQGKYLSGPIGCVLYLWGWIGPK